MSYPSFLDDLLDFLGLLPIVVKSFECSKLFRNRFETFEPQVRNFRTSFRTSFELVPNRFETLLWWSWGFCYHVWLFWALSCPYQAKVVFPSLAKNCWQYLHWSREPSKPANKRAKRFPHHLTQLPFAPVFAAVYCMLHFTHESLLQSVKLVTGAWETILCRFC